MKILFILSTRAESRGEEKVGHGEVRFDLFYLSSPRATLPLSFPWSLCHLVDSPSHESQPSEERLMEIQNLRHFSDSLLCCPWVRSNEGPRPWVLHSRCWESEVLTPDFEKVVWLQDDQNLLCCDHWPLCFTEWFWASNEIMCMKVLY